MDLLDLTNPLLEIIFEKLPPRDVIRLGICCRRLEELCVSNEKLWTSILDQACATVPNPFCDAELARWSSNPQQSTQTFLQQLNLNARGAYQFLEAFDLALPLGYWVLDEASCSDNVPMNQDVKHGSMISMRQIHGGLSLYRSKKFRGYLWQDSWQQFQVICPLISRFQGRQGGVQAKQLFNPYRPAIPEVLYNNEIANVIHVHGDNVSFTLGKGKAHTSDLSKLCDAGVITIAPTNNNNNSYRNQSTSFPPIYVSVKYPQRLIRDKLTYTRPKKYLPPRPPPEAIQADQGLGILQRLSDTNPIVTATYGTHGDEHILLGCAPPSHPLPDRCPFIPSFRLEGYKLVGDENVPNHKHTFVIDVSTMRLGRYGSSSGHDNRGTGRAAGENITEVVTFFQEYNHGIGEFRSAPTMVDVTERPVVARFDGFGQINSRPGRWNPKWLSVCLLLYEEGYTIPLETQFRGQLERVPVLFSILWLDLMMSHMLDYRPMMVDNSVGDGLDQTMVE